MLKDGVEHRVRDTKRTECLTVLFDDLRRVGRRDFHSAAARTQRGKTKKNALEASHGSSNGQKQQQQQQQQKDTYEQRDQNSSFKHISRATLQFLSAIEQAQDSLRTFPLSISWHHLIHVEDRARYAEETMRERGGKDHTSVLCVLFNVV